MLRKIKSFHDAADKKAYFQKTAFQCSLEAVHVCARTQAFETAHTHKFKAHLHIMRVRFQHLKNGIQKAIFQSCSTKTSHFLKLRTYQNVCAHRQRKIRVNIAAFLISSIHLFSTKLYQAYLPIITEKKSFLTKGLKNVNLDVNQR